MRFVAVLAALMLASAPAAAAKSTPIVPPFIQQLARAKAGVLAYVPTRVPLRYRYVGYGWNGRRLEIKVADRRFPLDGRHSVAFTAQRFGRTLASCGAGREKTLQMGGNKVYWDGAVAWRCVRASDGRLVRLAASGPNLPDVALARVVASGKRVASAARGASSPDGG
jgi:hypothetical protein